MQIPIIPFRGKKKPWNSIPRINWAHPLAWGLSFYGYDAGGNYIDLVNGSAGKLNVGTTNHVTRKISQWGTGLKYPITSNLNDWVSFPLIPRISAIGATVPYSWAAGCMSTASGPTNAPFVVTGDPSANTGPVIGVGSVSATTFSVGSANIVNTNTAAGTFSTNVFHTPVGVAISPTVLNIYVDGRLDSSPTVSTTTFTSAFLQPLINSNDTLGSAGGGANFVYYFALWNNRALSATDASLLHNDPYCFLIYPEDEIFATLVGVTAATTSEDQYHQPWSSIGRRYAIIGAG